ncbi:MAG: TetR/AcrR family transcriptional regulator [Streptosporangiales bacterium]|jgi:AcrR family transcriptional regulator|nr:TetR/AcrR family transcriptional regulator [Streptosporangiales bacterium]
MAASTPTRERIIDAAMSLFSDNGFRGTSVTQIETAAGLTPGAGGIYHHFRSKEELLAAGVERHLARLDALRDIRRLLTGLGDLRAELTVTARYVLAELDRESDLLRILASEARARPELVRGAADRLIRLTYTEFAAWLTERNQLPPERARAIADAGLGALMSRRLLGTVLGVGAPATDDDTFVTAWVDMMSQVIGG